MLLLEGGEGGRGERGRKLRRGGKRSRKEGMNKSSVQARGVWEPGTHELTTNF